METTYSDNDFNTGRKSKSSEILHGNKNTLARSLGELGTHCRESTYEREDMSNLREVQVSWLVGTVWSQSRLSRSLLFLATEGCRVEQAVRPGLERVGLDRFPAIHRPGPAAHGFAISQYGNFRHKRAALHLAVGVPTGDRNSKIVHIEGQLKPI